MEDLSFTIYQDNTLEQKKAQDLFRNKRILICSVTRPWQNISDQYVRYLLSLKDSYRELGIDDILFINSGEGLLLLAGYEKIHPTALMLHDNDNGFVSYLQVQQNRTGYSINDLSRYWSYQVLINDGKIEQFYEQPLSDYVRHLIKSKKTLNLDTHKFFVTEGDRTAIFRPILMVVEQERVSPYGHIFYFNIWPNIKLEQYLLDTRNKPTV